tara:strand:+ start:392 stop:562 length:171 start_codon:yes stop_codon:yes gene_type:complete
MSNEFLKKNFKSLKSPSAKDLQILQTGLKKNEDEEEIIKGVISNKELELLKKILPQ